MSASRAHGHVWLVGAGPGAPGLITVAGLEVLRNAEVVLYDRLAPPELLREAPAGATLIDAGKAAGNHAMTQDEINATLVEHARAGKRVVRLKGGDPYVFGRGGEEALALAEAGLTCTEIPGVTSAIAGLALAHIPITHRNVASSFVVVTGHEDPTKPETAVDWTRHARGGDTLVVLMGVGRLGAIAGALIEAGRDPSTPAALVHAAATPRQRVVTARLDEIARVALEAGIGAPSLLVVGEVVGLRPALEAAASPLAGKRVLITRTRAQASTLASAVQSEGGHPVVLPALELERRVDEPALHAAAEALRARAYRWVVFTSANGVDAGLEALRGEGLDARAFAGARILAIGDATARALLARGLVADLVPAEAVGEGVVEALVGAGMEGIEGARVLVLRAEGGRAVLLEGLRAAGATVDEVTLYVAAAPAEAPPEALALLRARQIDAVAFTSSSTVRNLLTVLGEDIEARAGLAAARVVSIGPATSETTRAAGLEVAREAEVHTVPGLVTALREALSATRQTAPREALSDARQTAPCEALGAVEEGPQR
ncbi:MAG: uroporphyrinogen-III C-methyltransferase [Dehalococcoidia bacterium]|nr:uroporphyrinogen-III C-methyltransferase [Dehalococcoidia bacterium]